MAKVEAPTEGATTTAETAELARGYRKSRRGYVLSNKMDKTIVVEVEDRVKHPLYGKVIRRTSKVKVHELRSPTTPAPRNSSRFAFSVAQAVATRASVMSSSPPSKTLSLAATSRRVMWSRPLSSASTSRPVVQTVHTSSSTRTPPSS